MSGSSMSRRTVLQAGAGLFSVGAPAAPDTDATSPGTDAELLELCAAFLAVATSVSAVVYEDDLALVLDGRESLAGRIKAIPPLSPAGMRAKAQVGLVLLSEGHPPGLAGDDVSFALTFLRDLAMGAPCAGLEIIGPDAELLTACAAFDALEHQSVALHDGPDRVVDDGERSRAFAAIVERQEFWLKRMCAIRVTCPVAWQARARSLALWDRDVLAGYEDGCVNERLLAALLRDMVA